MLKIIPILIPSAFVLMGSLFFFGSIIYILRRRAFLKTALETNGVVIDVEVRHRRATQSSSASTHHYPTVRFQIADGQVIDCKINISLNQLYQVGQTVIVNYNPRNPCNFIQLGKREDQPLFQILIFTFVGGIFAFVGLIWLTVSIASG